MSDTIKLGNSEINSFKVGSTDVDKIYLGSTLLYPSTPQHDYSKDYLTFEVVNSGTLTIRASAEGGINIYYSTDDGNTWNSLTTESTAKLIGGILGVGTKVLIKCTDTFATSTYNHYFGGSAKVNVSGNIMSLIYGDNFDGNNTLSDTYAFSHLFYNHTNIISAENLILPASTLTSNCYYSMFFNCTSLTTAPKLPATTLATHCYDAMFEYCTSLTTAPELPATTLASYCYQSMFLGCANLTTAPSVLPAMTLASYCYNNMFSSCTNLTTAPELPAKTLVSNCYQYMFRYSSSLNYIKAMFTTRPSYTYTNNWVQGVAASGTFVKSASASWTTTGNSGIPTGWTVVTA